jgi:hypothetical protein
VFGKTKASGLPGTSSGLTPTSSARPVDRSAFVPHNHFVLDRGGKVFKQTAPIIKLRADATEEDHLALLGYLNSSTACFWMKQVCFDKGNRGEGGGLNGRRNVFWRRNVLIFSDWWMRWRVALPVVLWTTGRDSRFSRVFVITSSVPDASHQHKSANNL